MKPVYTATETWDAHMVRDILINNGIDAVVEDRYSIHHTGRDRVLILNDDDEARALHIVRDFVARASDRPSDTAIVWHWRCPKCFEEVEPQFEVCWNCGTERPSS